MVGVKKKDAFKPDGRANNGKHGFKKGKRPPGAGRQRGTRNKMTIIIKDAIITAATMEGGREGLVGYLRMLARKYPKSFSYLLGKVLPMQMQILDRTNSQIGITNIEHVIVTIEDVRRAEENSEAQIIDVPSLPAPVETSPL